MLHKRRKKNTIAKALNVEIRLLLTVRPTRIVTRYIHKRRFEASSAKCFKQQFNNGRNQEKTINAVMLTNRTLMFSIDLNTFGF